MKEELQKIKEVIVPAAPELTFITGKPDEGVLAYLDLTLNTPDGLRWE